MQQDAKCKKNIHLFSNQSYIQCTNTTQIVRSQLRMSLCRRDERPLCFQFRATVASGYAEEPTDPRQLKSSPAKGSKVPPQGIYCPPTVIKSCNQTSVALWLLWFCQRLEVTQPGLTVAKFKPKMPIKCTDGKSILNTEVKVEMVVRKEKKTFISQLRM